MSLLNRCTYVRYIQSSVMYTVQYRTWWYSYSHSQRSRVVLQSRRPMDKPLKRLVSLPKRLVHRYGNQSAIDHFTLLIQIYRLVTDFPAFTVMIQYTLYIVSKMDTVASLHCTCMMYVNDARRLHWNCLLCCLMVIIVNCIVYIGRCRSIRFPVVTNVNFTLHSLQETPVYAIQSGNIY